MLLLKIGHKRRCDFCLTLALGLLTLRDASYHFVRTFILPYREALV